MTGTFDAVYKRSIEDPNGFWGEAAAGIDWIQPWDHVLDDRSPPFYRWFSGGVLNTCWNCLDRHVAAGRGDQIALIHDSPVTRSVKRFSYRELRDAVALFAGALVNQGVGKGDRVIIYMPMIPEALIAMLACARLGAVHSVVFGGFAPKELRSRIDDA
jgi:propionyl-CoA synthetase